MRYIQLYSIQLRLLCVFGVLGGSIQILAFFSIYVERIIEFDKNYIEPINCFW